MSESLDRLMDVPELTADEIDERSAPPLFWRSGDPGPKEIVPRDRATEAEQTDQTSGQDHADVPAQSVADQGQPGPAGYGDGRIRSDIAQPLPHLSHEHIVESAPL